ncbi:mucin-2-like [Ornithodoros turicata]|uniref:mucin-2-like n=1 Tax=Ornithodoros turicata TaxID=34597 RepID=UPI003138BED7
MKFLVSIVMWIWIAVTAWMPVQRHALVLRDVQSEGTREQTGGASSTGAFLVDQPTPMDVTVTAAGMQHDDTGEPASGEKNSLLQETSTLSTATTRRRSTKAGNLRTQSSHDTSRRSHWTEAQHAELHETTLPTVDTLTSTRNLNVDVVSGTETGLDDRLHGTAKTNGDTFATAEGENTQTAHSTTMLRVPIAESTESHAEIHATLSTLEHTTTTQSAKAKGVQDTDAGTSVTPNSIAGTNDDIPTTLGRNPQINHNTRTSKVSTEGEEERRTTLPTWSPAVTTQNVMEGNAPNVGTSLTGETNGVTETTTNDMPTTLGKRNRQTHHSTGSPAGATEGHAGPRDTLSTLAVLTTTQNAKEQNGPTTDIGPNGTPNGVTEVNGDMLTTVERDHSSTGTSKEPLIQTTEENHVELQVTTTPSLDFTSTQNSKKQDESSTANSMPNAAGNKSSHSDTTTTTLNDPLKETTTTEEPGQLHATTVSAVVSTQDVTTQSTEVPEIPHTTSRPPNGTGLTPTAEDQSSKDSTPSRGPNGTTTDGLTESHTIASQTPDPPTSTHTSNEDEVSITDTGIVDQSTQSNIVSPATVDQTSPFSNSRTTATTESYPTTTVGQAELQSTTTTTQSPTTDTQVSEGHDEQSTPEPATETGDGVFTPSDAGFKPTPTRTHDTSTVTTEPTVLEVTSSQSVTDIPNDTEIPVDDLDKLTTEHAITGKAEGSETSITSSSTTMQTAALQSNITRTASTASGDSTTAYTESDKTQLTVTVSSTTEDAAITSGSPTNDSDATVTSTQVAVTGKGGTSLTPTGDSELATHRSNESDAVTTASSVDPQTEKTTDVDPIGTRKTTTSTETSNESFTTSRGTTTKVVKETTVTTSVGTAGGHAQSPLQTSSHVISTTPDSTSSALNDWGTSTISDFNITHTPSHSADSAGTTVNHGRVTTTDTPQSSTRNAHDTTSGHDGTMTSAGISESTSPQHDHKISPTTTQSPDKGTSSTDGSTSSGAGGTHTTETAGSLPPGSSGTSTSSSPEFTGIATTISSVPSESVMVTMGTASRTGGPTATATSDVITRAPTPATAPARNASGAPATPKVPVNATSASSTGSSPPTTAKPPRVVIPHLPDVPKPISPLPLAPDDTHVKHGHLPPIPQPIKPGPLR